MKDQGTGVVLCDICLQPIIKEKDDGLHYPKNDYHVSPCFIDRLRQKGLAPAQWPKESEVLV